MLYELSIEFESYSGESKDDTIKLDSNNISAGNIQKRLDDFTHRFYNEGYDELSPRDFKICPFNYNLLRNGVVVCFCGCLKISLNEVLI